jgi:hypothetical protein
MVHLFNFRRMSERWAAAPEAEHRQSFPAR